MDTAIWDLYGKIKNKPVVELLGGRICDIPVYGSSMSREITPEDEAARMVALRDKHGFTAFKLRVGKKNGHDVDQWPGRSEKLVPTVRIALGNETDLMVDANSCYTPPKAIALGRILEDNNIFFFEEPCPYWELEWTAEVTSKISVKVAGGEQDNELSQWRRMIQMNAVDIAQPDVCYIGGLTRAYRVARMAEKAGKLLVPHTSNWSMVSIFSLHLLGAFKNRRYLEYTIDGTTELANTNSTMYTPQLIVDDGKVKIPDGPGWGVTFNQKWLESATYRKSEI
jgi:L-alanine-DL-glutamate epimerase-like enolase superfamily enzyme